ncbi:MAG: efflux RND transporter periplasmic adaptor subunit [Albidovulum sp.]
MKHLILPVLMVLAPALHAEETSTLTATAARPVVSVIVNPKVGLSVTYTGTVAARIEADLGFPLIGTMTERTVSAGDVVRAGDVLARLDPETLDADQRAAEAGVSVAQAQLRSATDARDRARALVQSGAGSETRLEDAQRALVAAAARLEQAKASLASAKDMRGLAVLTAPQDGVVTDVFAEPGTTLSAGQPVLRLAATGAREVIIDLSETDVATLPANSKFSVQLAANNAVTAMATLSRVDPIAERNTRTRRLHLTLDSPPDAFRLGALVWAKPQAGTDAEIILPAAAILEADSATPKVWVVKRTDNTVQRQPVTIGPTVTGYVVVRAGLAAGAEVVVKGINSLQDGQVVGPRVAP